MSPAAGDLLLEHIVPRLRSAIPKCVKPVGAEDPEELVQDAIVVAAQMLHSVETAGKSVTPGNIAYYTILHMKCGRRSQCRSRADAMANGTQLDVKSSVLSTEEEVGYDPEIDEAIRLEDLLAGHHEDPALAAGRDLDWSEFLASHDYRYGVIVKSMLEGRSARDTADRSGAGFSRIYQLQSRLADDLRNFLGQDAIADASRTPQWRGNIRAGHEHAACAAARRKAP